MFATLLGALPAPPTAVDDSASGATTDASAFETVVRAQEAAGLEPITDGRPADDGWIRGRDAAQATVERWRRTQALTDRAVKQVLLGPWTASLEANTAGSTGGTGATAAEDADSVAAMLAATIRELATAGCRLVEIEERFDRGDGRLDDHGEAFHQLHEALLKELGRHGGEIHLSLSLTGGAAPEAWREQIVGLPYSSLAVDLIHGSDNWHLVTRFPGDRGVIAGALSEDGSAIADAAGEPIEVLQWAANYAASTEKRGLARVGLGSAGSWANLTWEAAVARMQRLGDAARIAAMPPGAEKARQFDPRAISSRRAALGHDAPPPPKRR